MLNNYSSLVVSPEPNFSAVALVIVFNFRFVQIFLSNVNKYIFYLHLERVNENDVQFHPPPHGGSIATDEVKTAAPRRETNLFMDVVSQ